MNKTHGFALVTAIIVLVLLASLATFLLRFTGTQQMASAFDILGSQALYAARAGSEWGLYRALRQGNCTPGVAVPHPWTAVQVASGSSFPVGSFTVTVLCEKWDEKEADGTTVTLYRVTATACNQPDGAGNCPNFAPGNGYVERQWVAG